METGEPPQSTDDAERADRHHALSKRLAAMDDTALQALLGEVTRGFGGDTTTVTVDGTPVFVKLVPLTDLERRPENLGSTANLFHLPLFYQYGIGSAGFGAWRELAVHTMTTAWALDGGYAGFPLVHHWRVLPRTPNPMDAADLDRWVKHWDDDAAVRARLTAIGGASAAIALFMEHFPLTLDVWLAGQGEQAYDAVDRALAEGAAFLRSQGLIHFDAHFRNLLTDGQRIYFADFGLAVHTGFDLDAAEQDFHRRHLDYDRSYTAAHLARWLIHRLLDVPWPEVLGRLRAYPSDPGLPPAADRIVRRHLPTALITGGFFEQLWNDKSTPYPAEELRRLRSR
ncbi:serine/threonine protein phosphatase [Actinoplanes sp. NPDC026670]|uniref:serine/threonine protein phosphatase n=1 Tax=Actinoplanes sp. NPDC026670 TaxID=3154700 RepID=UPI0034099A74